jgi:hypothetical protein
VHLIINMGIYDWLENHFVTCSFKQATGVDCLGCGMQRSFVSLLRGDLVGSIRYYPPLFFFLSYLLSVLLYSMNVLKVESETIRRMTIALLTIVILSYIYKAIFFGLTH